MKKYFYPFGSLIFLIFWVSGAIGQDEPHGQWSFAAFGGFDYSVSSSMHGDMAQYQAALENGTTAAQYPFGGNRFYSIGLEGQVAYRYAKSPISIYFGAYGSNFYAGYGGFRFSQTGRFAMSIVTATAGVEYTFGQVYQRWNFFGRFGLNSSAIAGNYRVGNGNRFTDTMVNSTDTRFGFEAEIGERYNFPRTPFGIEASINYANINLFGKSYTTPVLQQPFFRAAAGSINDGKNPNDPSDNARTIDYLSFRLGARIYF